MRRTAACLGAAAVALALAGAAPSPVHVNGGRLKDLLLKYCKVDSSEIIARTMEAVNQWTGAASELQDDMTMMVARRI